MENELIIGGLIRKRADLAGEVAVIHDKLRALQTDLAHVEATLRMFQPDIDMTAARVSRKPGENAAGYGQMSKSARDVMRGADDFLTLRQIQEAVMKLRDMDATDCELAVTVRKRVGAALRNLKRRGQAEDRHGAGLAMEWRLKG